MFKFQTWPFTYVNGSKSTKLVSNSAILAENSTKSAILAYLKSFRPKLVKNRSIWSILTSRSKKLQSVAEIAFQRTRRTHDRPAIRCGPVLRTGRQAVGQHQGGEWPSLGTLPKGVDHRHPDEGINPREGRLPSLPGSSLPKRSHKVNSFPESEVTFQKWNSQSEFALGKQIH